VVESRLTTLWTTEQVALISPNTIRPVAAVIAAPRLWGSRVLTPDGDDRFWALITVAMAKISARTPDANAEADHRRSDLHWGGGLLMP
jgi:hypothetical protein